MNGMFWYFSCKVFSATYVTSLHVTTTITICLLLLDFLSEYKNAYSGSSTVVIVKSNKCDHYIE